jgi:hypothetical protein
MNCTATAYAMPYVKAEGTAVTVNAETADFAVAAGLLSAPGFSMAASFSEYRSAISNPRLHGSLCVTSGCGTFVDSYYGAAWHADSSASSVVDYNTTRTITSETRVSSFHDGVTFNGCVGSTCGAGTASTWTPANFVIYRAGEYNTSTGVIDAIQSNVCISANHAECR